MADALKQDGGALPEFSPLQASRQARVRPACPAASPSQMATLSRCLNGPGLHSASQHPRPAQEAGASRLLSATGAFGYTSRPRRSGGMVDAADSKSAALKSVWVRVPPSAPDHARARLRSRAFCVARAAQAGFPGSSDAHPAQAGKPARNPFHWCAGLLALPVTVSGLLPGSRGRCAGQAICATSGRGPQARTAGPGELRREAQGTAWVAVPGAREAKLQPGNFSACIFLLDCGCGAPPRSPPSGP